MSVVTSGTVTAPAAVRTHTEPTSPVAAGAVASGNEYIHDYGDYVNTGNVDQTLDVTVSGLTGCTLESVQALDTGGNTLPLPVTVSVNEPMRIRVKVRVDTEAIGSDPVPFSYTVDDGVWS